MTQPIVVGITGNIGSGKSTVAVMLEQHLEELDLPVTVVDADAIVRALQRPGLPGWVAIVEEFGVGIVDPVSEEIDRQELAKIVFEDADARERLNHIIHPMVRLEERRLIDEAQAEGSHVLLVVPLLFETGLNEWCDAVIVVTVPEEVRFQRLAETRGMTPEQIRARLAGQIPEEDMMRRATVVVDNRGDLKSLRRQVAESWDEISGAEQP
jgi:dephospho-CoA kinase